MTERQALSPANDSAQTILPTGTALNTEAFPFLESVDPVGCARRKGSEESLLPLVDKKVIATTLTVSFQDETGIAIEHKDGHFLYRLGHSQDQKVLFVTDDGAPGMQAARDILAKMVEEKSAAIEKKFGVHIARGGEDAVKQKLEAADCSVKDGDMIKARSATVPELIGLEAALERSRPSELGGDGRDAVKFYFLTKNFYDPGNTSAYYVQSDDHNHRAIYLDPQMLQGVPILASDAPAGSPSRYYSVEAIFVHELGHNSEYNMGWKNIPVQKRMARATGWSMFKDPTTNQTGWLMLGKHGKHYRFDAESCITNYAWITADAQGHRLNAKGEQVSSFSQAHQVGDAAKKARFRPATDYYSNPTEEVAEALMLIRLSAEDRAYLHRINPKLYKVVKEHDQAEINAAYGVDNAGRANYLRGVDGLLVANTPENARKTRALEK